MDFEFDDDQLELRDAARSVLSSTCPPSLVRAVFEGRDTADALWTQLVELGWPALVVDEAHGGLGRSFIDLAVVIEELGRAVDPTPFLVTTTQFLPLVRDAVATGAAERLLPAVAEGSITGALALAEDGMWSPEGVTTTARAHGGGWVIDGTKFPVQNGATVDRLAVVVRLEGTEGDEGLGVLVVDPASADVRPCTNYDPTTPLAEVRFDHVVVGSDAVLVEPGAPSAAEMIRRALEEATVAIALSMTATCRAMFERTLQYAKEREQFGRPIGSFQALQHRFVELYLSVERATSVAYFAAAAIAEDDERRRVATHMAKAAAGDCQRLLVKDCLQLHGGIGFTWEYDLHFWLKRAKACDPLFGSGLHHRAAIAPLIGLRA